MSRRPFDEGLGDWPLWALALFVGIALLLIAASLAGVAIPN